MALRNVREVASGLRFPEGPIAMPDGSLILVEIEARTLVRIGADGRKEIVAELGGGPNGAAIGPDGACYVCNNGGFNWTEDRFGLRPSGQAGDYSGGRIERVDLGSGKVEVLFTHSDQAPLKGPNDLVFDAFGGFYFTDRGKVRHREEDRGAVCYAAADGRVREVIFPIDSPNGIGLSPDGRTLYVAETETARLWAFDLDGPGEIRKAPFPSPHGGRFVGAAPGWRRFDSLAVDSLGRVCVATLMNGGLTVIDPEAGEAVVHPLDDPFPTNICFGGPDLRTAFLTLSATGRVIAADWDCPGAPLHFLNT